ncbi:hypothetical protein J1N35_015049 [Gossypium stocksii]|uniref:Aminotransferase-like plant mobile domain-containing protein n=1 Tax=Gossypium stocksii TaxID=47602 RepID=A0A9D3VWH7_9ROSI|nr:hypothetical protein J1N35_015049 [Gossypium stocksii]
MAFVGRGCKLDPKLVSVLMERWRPRRTHSIFHATSVLSFWRMCIYNWGYRWMGDVSGDATMKNQNWWLHSTTAIMGAILAAIFTSSSELPVYIPTHNKFECTPYEDLTIREVIPKEFFMNLNTWHVKVPLVVYAIVEMHEIDRVLQQFRFRQSIPVAPQDLDDLHFIDLWWLDENWLVFHSQHINMWNNQYDFLLTREPIVISELTCNPEYMPWFRIYGQPYLLGEEARGRHPHTSKP